MFFYPSDSALAAGQAWWKRAHERNRDTSGEERSKFVSTNYEDGGAGIKAMGEAGSAFSDLANRADGSYDRLGEISIPVFVAQGHDDFMIPTYNS